MRDTVEWAIRRTGVSLPTPVFGIPLLRGSPAPRSKPDEAEKLSATATSLAILATLAVCYTLYLARSVILPVVLAILFSFLLRTPVRTLRRRLGLRESIGALIVVLGAVGTIGVSMVLLSAPAASWLSRAPQAMADTERKLRGLATALGRLEATAAKAERIAAGSASGTAPRTTVVTAPPTSIVRRLFGTAANFLVGALSVILLTYFLLASGDLFMRKLLKVLPNELERDGIPQRISEDVESAISLYLRTAVAINVGLGVATWGLLMLLGMPNAGLFGTLAGLLNFVPYLGALLTTGVLAVASIAVFDTLQQAALVPGAYLVLNLIESNIVTPLLMGVQFPLNTVAIFIGVLFWSFVWGAAGAILAVPIMVVLKILCDAIPALHPVGEFLGP